MILSRVEGTLECFQGEAQHGFRSGRRMEEHLLTKAEQQSSWIAVVDHQLRFIESLPHSKLGNALESFALTKCFGPN